MKKPYNSSKDNIIKNSTTNYGGNIDSVIKEDKKGIEKTYIKEGYDYRKEVTIKTPENISRELKSNNYKSREIHSGKYDEIKYNKNEEISYRNNYKEKKSQKPDYNKEEIDRVKSYGESDTKKYTLNEETRLNISEDKSNTENIRYRESRYSHKNTTDSSESINFTEQKIKSLLNNEKSNIDRVTSYRNKDSKIPSYKIHEENTQPTPENIANYGKNHGKYDTDFISTGKASSFILRKLKSKDMIYYENRHEDNNISKLIDRDGTNLLKDRGKKEKRRGNFEGRNEERTIRPDGIIEKNLTTRTLENRYIRSRFAENMGDGDENFSINLSKSGIISGEKTLKLGGNLGRYTSVKAINLFKKEKIDNINLKSTLTRSTKDAIINFKGGNSDDFGLQTVVNTKDKAIQAGRLLIDRKGFIKTSVTNFELQENQDLGIRTAIQTKDATVLGTRVVKGVYGTTKATAKTAKRTYQIGKKATERVAYEFSKFFKILSNPMVLKGIISIMIPLALILIIVSTVTAIFPTSTAIASYPIAEVEFIEELQNNINTWNEEINSTIQGYYSYYDDVLILNDDMVLVQLKDVLAILAVETQQDIGFKDMPLAKDIYEMFYSLYTEVEIYEEVESYYDSELEEYVDFVVEKKRIIVDLINFSIEDVIDALNYDETNKEWAITLSLADLTEMYPDLVVTNELYYPGMPSLTPEEIEEYGGKFIHPTNGVGYISSHFGYRIDPITNERKFHSGLDIAGNDRSPIYAVQDGVVIFAGVNGGYGNCVIIDHGGGMITLYAHCSSLEVTKGQSILGGDYIGRVGNTGRSTGPHLHLEVRINGKLINPINFL